MRILNVPDKYRYFFGEKITIPFMYMNDPTDYACTLDLSQGKDKHPPGRFCENSLVQREYEQWFQYTILPMRFPYAMRVVMLGHNYLYRMITMGEGDSVNGDDMTAMSYEDAVALLKLHDIKVDKHLRKRVHGFYNTPFTPSTWLSHYHSPLVSFGEHLSFSGTKRHSRLWSDFDFFAANVVKYLPLSHHQIVQEIDMWVANKDYRDPNDPGLADKDRIKKAGFHLKKSFRHRK